MRRSNKVKTGETPDREGIPLPGVLRTYWVWLMALSAVAAFMGNIYWWLNRFSDCCKIPDHDPDFVDLWHYHVIFGALHTPRFFTGSDHFAYPTFSAVVFDLIYHLGPHTQAIFAITELTVCGFAAVLFYRKIRDIGLRRFAAVALVLPTLLFSFPLQMLFESGNIEIVVILFTAGGLVALLKGQEGLAAVLWGAAAAMKIYPIILLALFVSRSKYRFVLIGVVSFLLIAVLSMWFIGPTIPMAFHGMLDGIGGFVSTYAQKERIWESGFDHSLLEPVKLIGFVLHTHGHGAYRDPSKGYFLVAGAAALAAFFLRVRHMPIANRIIFLFAAMVALPPVSYQYTLVHEYAPWAMLTVAVLRTAKRGQSVPNLRPMFICFAVIFTSQNYIFHHDLRVNGTSQAIALLVLMVAVMRQPVPDALLVADDSHPCSADATAIVAQAAA